MLLAFVTELQKAVYVCLEMCYCVSAEQLWSCSRVNFFKKFTNSNNIVVRTFAAESAKVPATL